MRKYGYGNDILKLLYDVRIKRRSVEELITVEIFIRNSLTDAALSGCHHCGEGDKDSPCQWCGLKNA